MDTKPAALAVAAHPDDIEFMMAGTLLMLRDVGWSVHCMTIANGSCGTATDPPDVIVATREAEARAACRAVGAVWHPPLCNDLEIFYTNSLIRGVCAVVRKIRPRILLTHSPRDYMEDHTNACRIAVTAAFCRGMRNFASEPPVPPIGDDVTVYHALPYGLRDPLRRLIRAGQYVNVGPVLEEKRTMLACHRSQKEWLDESQGLDAYLDTMATFCRRVGEMSGVFDAAEGWRRRFHPGFCGEADDPLTRALGRDCVTDPVYETGLDSPGE